MKLIQFGLAGEEQPGLVIDNKYYDLSAFFDAYDEDFFADDGINKLKTIAASKKDQFPELPPGVRLGAPVGRPSKIICIGLNYADHARETGAKPPEEPVIFMKASSALCGPYDDVILPKGSEKTDWEVELAVVIGSKAGYVEEGEAMKYVAGYCLHNDISERSFQLERGGTWDKGKGCDHFAPLGPWLVTKDEIKDVNHLRIWLELNGKPVQESNTANLIFKIPFLVSYVSQFMTLLPGDIISTGTPAGVGLGFNPPLYLKPGDVMELGIDGLGTARQKCITYIG
ncbi:MAG: ureidoglycolate lyase [Terrimonas sp.]|nr:ureidoglycolate lyase [Terrimonas sp.]